MNKIISSQAQKVLTLGQEKYWGFRVIEGFGVMTRDTYNDGWWLLPTDDSIRIQKADKRIQAIKNSGVKIRQVIVAHEAPRLLCAPKTAPKVSTHHSNWKWVVIGLVLAVVGLVAMGLIFYALAMAAYYVLTYILPLVGTMLTFVLVFGMLSLGVLIDPAVIVVLESGERIEVLRWVE